MKIAYDHVVKMHTLVETADKDVRLSCPVAGCEHVIIGYVRAVAVVNMYGHLENHVSVTGKGK